MQQNSMFVNQPLVNVGESHRSLLWLANKLANNQLELPPFQRDFVWKNDKIAGWANSIKKRDAIGVIVTYQIPSSIGGNYTVFLLDGRQRLGSSIIILENFSNYEFPDYETAQLSMDAFLATVQHRHYNSHNDAMIAFQNLNKGTQATPADYYRGELTNNPGGDSLYHNIIEIMAIADSKIIKNFNKEKAKKVNKFSRDSLALFYQYITGYKGRRFWDVSRSTITSNTNTPIEALVMEHYQQTSNIKNDIRVFESFLEQQSSLIETILSETRGKNLLVSQSLYRHCLHFAIWRKNNKIPVHIQSQYYKLIFQHSPSLNASIILPENEHYKQQNQTLHLSNLNTVTSFGKIFDIPELLGKSSRKQRAGSIRKGYDNSHINPFAIHGDGETTPEPAPLNRSRGMKPMFPEDKPS